MAVKFDDIDRKIIVELERDSRVSMTALASRVGLSRNAVRQRLDRMERHRIIAGYTIRLGSPERMERPISAFMFVTRRDRMRGADVTAALRKIPEISLCHILSGEKDLLMRVDAASQDRIKEIWDELAKLPGVTDICTNFSLSTIVDRGS